MWRYLMPFLLVLLNLYVIKARESDYTIIRQTKELKQVGNTFKIIWNVPTFQCHKYGYNFQSLHRWGIVQNHGDSFRGDKIALLYDPGSFPALLEANRGGDLVPRNGGVPQEGDLALHLKLFADHVEKHIPNRDFSGYAVIDFEHWRPIWTENFGTLNAYRKWSRDIVMDSYPMWNNSEVENKASYDFEESARQFFLATLQRGKLLRPKARWGYYGFPMCFNYTPKNQQASCTNDVMESNERLNWLFGSSSALYPSLYYKKYGMNEEKRALFMNGRISEAMRIRSLIAMDPYTPDIFSYISYKYYDSKEFVSKTDLLNSFMIPKKHGCRGTIIWGASNDVNSEQKCKILNDYVDTILGPSAKFVLEENSPNGEIDKLFYYNSNVHIPSRSSRYPYYDWFDY